MASVSRVILHSSESKYGLCMSFLFSFTNTSQMCVAVLLKHVFYETSTICNNRDISLRNIKISLSFVLYLGGG